MFGRLIPFLSTIFFLSPKINGGQVTSIFSNHLCDPQTATWTAWFNTQDPMMNNGNDMEDLAIIRNLYQEVSSCENVLNVDYALSQPANNQSGSYHTFINQNGLFCMASSGSRCPNYQVRFCCAVQRRSSMGQCGYTYYPPDLSSSLRIVNGIQARRHSFPWAVSLQHRGVHDCGGVILDQWNILTAAHCLDYSHDLRNYFARVGAHERSSSGQLIPIAQLILHPNYHEGTSTNDIGIIRLATPITFSAEIQPICLMDNILEPPLDSTVYVVGWGNTVYQLPSSSSPVLLQARLRVVSDCSMYLTYQPQRQICAAPNGPAGKDHGSCQGDSGGGLFYYKNGRWYVAGVVSYANGCGRRIFPTVFTKTVAYLDWIRAVINRPILT